jgi:hypothetical protein
MLELFNAVHTGQLELFHLNFDEIILLPKVNETESIQQYMRQQLLGLKGWLIMLHDPLRLLLCEEYISQMG